MMSVRSRGAVLVGCWLGAVVGSSCARVYEPALLVPPTVKEDSGIPALEIVVGGKRALVHYKVLGSTNRPPLFVIHGSVSDMRPYECLSWLSNRYRVVFWDMRGNGLSERVPKEDLAIDRMVEEIAAVRARLAPGKRVTLIGHSWSAFFVALYAARYPSTIDQLVLMEPNGFSAEIMSHVPNLVNLFTTGYLDMAYMGRILTPQDHATLDYRTLAMLTSGVRNFFCDPNRLPPWPVRRVGGLALMVWEAELVRNGVWDFDYTRGLDGFTNSVLLVGSSCSPIGYDFQDRYHRPLFRNARTARIEGSGHRMLTEQPAQVFSALSNFLSEYP